MEHSHIKRSKFMNEYLHQNRCSSSSRCSSRESLREETNSSAHTASVYYHSNGSPIVKEDDFTSLCLEGVDFDESVVGWSDKDDFSIFHNTYRPRTAHASSTSYLHEPYDEFFAAEKSGERPFSALPVSRTKYKLSSSTLSSSKESETKQAMRRRRAHRITFKRALLANKDTGAEEEEEGYNQESQRQSPHHHSHQFEQQTLQPQSQQVQSEQSFQQQQQPQQQQQQQRVTISEGDPSSNLITKPSLSREGNYGLPSRQNYANGQRRRVSSAEMGRNPSPNMKVVTWNSKPQQATTTTTFMNSLSHPIPLNTHKHTYRGASSARRGNLKDILRLQPVLKSVSHSNNNHCTESNHKKETEIHQQHLHQLRQQQLLQQQQQQQQQLYAGASRSSSRREEEMTTRSVLTLRMRPFSSSSPTSLRALPALNRVNHS